VVTTAIRTLGGRAKRRLPGRAAVLAYHRVASPAQDPWHLAVTPEHFDGHLGALGRVGRVTSLDEVLTTPVLRRVGHASPRFAITFDDGYADNLHAALPLLERHAAPATIFIAPGLLDEPSFWWDVLAAWALGSERSGRCLAGAGASCGVLDERAAHDLIAADASPAAVHDAIYPGVQQRPLAEIGPLLAALAAASGVTLPVPDGRPLTTAELLELAAHPLVSIGIHTVTHPRLTLLEPAAAAAEISAAEVRLTELLGGRRRVLAYPYGDTSPAVARLAATTGVTHAVTTDARWVGAREDPLLVPRLHPHDDDGATFEAWIRRWA
jgi:peptidoglycan/xylan/chitin deacetylase (PgdA/CDA1 family)